MRIGHVKADKPLSAALAVIFYGKSVADFGCGPGGYTRFLRRCGIDADGFDANPSYPGYVMVDLALPVTLSRKCDWVLALEIGEHIPKKFEHNFLENVHAHNQEGVVVSWAIPGQGGRGHFNEQPNDYVVSQFLDRGYSQDLLTQEILRKVATYFWFKNTIMFFKNGLHHPISPKHPRP